MATRIDGQCLMHKIITDTCRERRGPEGCWNFVRDELFAALTNAFEQTEGQGFIIHVALTVERPPRRAREDEVPA